MMNFHHIGIATEEIKDCKAVLESMCDVKQASGVIFDPEQGAYLCMLELANGFKFELVQGKVVEHLVKKGITCYHLCFCVADIEAEVKRLTADNALLIKNPAPAVLFNGRKVAFLQTQIGLIELLEQRDEHRPAE